MTIVIANPCKIVGGLFSAFEFEMAPSLSVNFVSPVTSCVGFQEEEPQTAFPMSFTLASDIAASVLTGCETLLIQDTPCFSG